MKPNINLHLGDCMKAMKTMEDNQFDLAIVDPPYGIGASNYKRGGTQYGNSKARCKIYTPKDWDNVKPSMQYFEQLVRISKNQIIFGANHFIEKIANADSSCWIVWDKNNGIKSGYADCELAWTSFKTAVRKFLFRWSGMLQENMKNKEIRIHPTQKPVALYKWLLQNYAKEGDKIIDTHGGSMNIAIACWDLGFDLELYEIDKDYYNDGIKRYKKYIRQGRFFKV